MSAKTAAVIGSLLFLLAALAVATAQTYQPDDPVPPGSVFRIVDLESRIIDLQYRVEAAPDVVPKPPDGKGARPGIASGPALYRLGPVTFAQGESGGQPVGRADRFQEGVKALYAFFDFQGLKGEDTVKGVWFRGTDQLLEQSVKMSEVYGAAPVPKKGRLTFSIKFEEGAPAGGYSVEISVNGLPGQAALVAVDPK